MKKNTLYFMIVLALAAVGGMAPSVPAQGWKALLNQAVGGKPKPKAKVDNKNWIEPTHKDIAYGSHPRQTLNFWKAKSDKPTPVLVQIHGGGWMKGAKQEKWNPSQFLNRGISVASIEYRFTTDAPMPAPLLDSGRAIQFIRSKASEWGLDKTRFAFTGGSAGADISMWLATHDDLADPQSTDTIARESTKPLCVVALNGQPLMDPPVNAEWIQFPLTPYPPLINFFGYKDYSSMKANLEKDRPRYRECSAQPWADKNDPPIYMVCPNPAAVPPASINHAIHHPIYSIKFKEKLDELGVENYLQCEGYEAPMTPDEFICSKLLGTKPNLKNSNSNSNSKPNSNSKSKSTSSTLSTESSQSTQPAKSMRSKKPKSIAKEIIE